jgi:hypothetical protein
MKWMHLAIGAIAATVVVASLGAGSTAASAQSAQGSRLKGKVPDNFPYEIRNGRRVPKGKRVVAADGSWKEEVRDGACAIVRERNAAGEYREVRKCD